MWIGIAVWFLIDALKSKAQKRWFYTVSGIVFFLFGLSDFVELETGAWWRPWWLLAWKGGCLLGFLAIYIWYKKKYIHSK